MSKNWKKTYSKKLEKFSWDPKLSLGLQKGRPSYRRSFQPSKENIQLVKTCNCLIFSTFVGHFCPTGSGSGSTDLIESGSHPDPKHCFTARRNYFINADVCLGNFSLESSQIFLENYIDSKNSKRGRPWPRWSQVSVSCGRGRWHYWLVSIPKTKKCRIRSRAALFNLRCIFYKEERVTACSWVLFKLKLSPATITVRAALPVHAVV
jgi:hypothetical protein